MIDGILVGGTSLYWIMWGHFFDRGFYPRVGGGSFTDLAATIPNIDRVASTGVRLAGFFAATTSIYVMAVAATSFRRREPWAWYVMWTLPVLAALDFGLLAGNGGLTLLAATWDVTVFGLALVALVLPYRAFFPNGG
jgi:hypothetical protein